MSIEVSSVGRFRASSPLRKPPAAPPSGGPVDGFLPGETQDIPNSPPQAPRARPLALAFMAASTLTGVLGVLVPPAQAQIVQMQAQPAHTPTAVNADIVSHTVVLQRHGQLLGSGRILKIDNYPGLHTASLQTGERRQALLEGAPNFRQVPDASIYGVAQPTAQGLRNVLRELHAGPGQDGPEVAWTTLREEPVIYIDGRSLTLRAETTPFSNMEAPGISAQTVEERETQLRQDILEEAKRYDGRLLIHDEAPDGSVTTRWVTVSEDTVKTPRQIFDEARAEGYRVNYARVAITDEKAPEDADFDTLVERLRGLPANSPLVFNCHAGRGRTTTGIVIGELMRGQGGSQTADIQGNDRYERGDYRVINDLLGVLENGSSAKEGVDRAIDGAGSVQNLRLAIARLKARAAENPNRAKAERDTATGKDYLHRYFKLVAFNAYLQEQAPQGFPVKFSDWVAQHPQLNITPNLIELVYNQTPVEAGGTRLA